jgi:MraZ protein
VSLLVGQYDCTLDAKKRLMVPADFRRELDRNRGTRWYAVLHRGNRLWLVPEDEFSKLAEKIRPTLLPTPEQVEFTRKLFSRSQVIEPDKQGRIVLPEKLVSKAALGGEVTLVGNGRYIEINDRARWQAEQTEENFDEVMDKARQVGIEGI